MELGSTKLEQVSFNWFLYCLFILLFPALVVGVRISYANLFESGYLFFEAQRLFSLAVLKGWGLSAKLGKHSAIWGKLGTALQAYPLNPCTKFPPNPTSRKQC